MKEFEFYSKVLLNGRQRILFVKKGQKTKYIKNKGIYVKLSDYIKSFKKQIKIIQIGGELYDNNDLNDTVIQDNVTYIRDKESEYPTPLIDMITGGPIKKEDAIIVNNHVYDIEGIYVWFYTQLQRGVSIDDITDPYRNKVARDTFYEAKDLYGNLE